MEIDIWRIGKEGGREGKMEGGREERQEDEAEKRTGGEIRNEELAKTTPTMTNILFAEGTGSYVFCTVKCFC